MLELKQSDLLRCANQTVKTYSVDPDHPAFLSLLDGRPSTIRVKVDTVLPRLMYSQQHGLNTERDTRTYPMSSARIPPVFFPDSRSAIHCRLLI